MMVRIGQLPINEKTSKSQMFVRLPSLAGCGLIRGADWDSMGSDSGGLDKPSDVTAMSGRRFQGMSLVFDQAANAR